MLVPIRKAVQLTGLSANTLRKYADNGTIKAQRIGRGQRLFDVADLLQMQKPTAGKPVVCYCRVSSQKQKDDLARQVVFMRERYPNAEINKKVVRAMQSYRFFEFSERLKNKCLEYGCILIRSNEAYTSKTNSFNGEVFNIGSRKRFKYDGIYVDRDINGARNILLRAMRDSSACGCNATG